MKTLFEAVKSKALEYGFDVEIRGDNIGVKSTPVQVGKIEGHYVVFVGNGGIGFDSLDMAIGHLGSLLSQYALKRDLSAQTGEVVDSPTNTPKVAHSANGEELEGIEATLAERQAQYGDFEDVAETTERLFAELKGGASFVDLSNKQRMVMYMICSKMARIVNGDVNHRDGWHDIGGYSKLIEDSLVAKK